MYFQRKIAFSHLSVEDSFFYLFSLTNFNLEMTLKIKQDDSKHKYIRNTRGRSAKRSTLTGVLEKVFFLLLSALSFIVSLAV